MAVEETLAERVELCFGLHQTAELHAWREACGLWGFESPGARGWLLALVREAWDAGNASTRSNGVEWWVVGFCRGDDAPSELGRGATEDEALVAAMEAAP